MATMFGFEIRRKGETQSQEEDKLQTFAPKHEDDGALVVASGGAYGTYVDLEGSARTEAELVTKYRDMMQHPEVENAVDDVVNEAIVVERGVKTVDINLNKTRVSTNIKNLISDEFNNILNLLNFNSQPYEVFKNWYVDGRCYYHVVIDPDDLRSGIKELRLIDPRKIRKVREIKKKKDQTTREGVTVTKTVNEYYVYNDKGFASLNNSLSQTVGAQGLKIAKDSIIHCTSGLLDTNSTLVLSHLHKAIKPLNQLRALEDATVIYRISRAPERRIFYIDVGNLPKMKAEQYLRDMMVRHKNKLVYDSTTGEIRDDRKFMTMLEDYWLPRREGNRGTEITTLPAGQNLGEMEDVLYFQKKLYRSLLVPETRLSQDATFSMGRDTEITREEIKFAKFVDRLRTKFCQLFLKSLEKQLVLKQVITTDDWKEIGSTITFDFARDNYFAQLKEMQILNERMSAITNLQPV
ncbi:portal protein, partial [bacterium]|nr:portal protein [bacterium]